MTAASSPDVSDAASLFRVGVFALFAITAASFLPTLLNYVQVKEGIFSSYDYLVVGGTVWYVWRERGTFEVRSEAWRPALLLMGVLSVVWLVATVTRIEIVTQAAVPLMLLLWASAIGGPRVGLRLTPILAIVLIAVPLVGVVRGVLQTLTVAVSGKVVALFGVSAVIEEQMIHTTYGSFLVAGYCAGVSYLLVGLLVGTLHAQRAFRTALGTGIAIALAAFFPIVGNWIRVAGLILIGDASRMESPIIASPGPHALFGWGIFVVSLVLFFVSAGRLERFEARRRDPAGPTDDPSGSGASAPGLRAPVLATAVAIIGPATYLVVGSLPSQVTPSLDFASRDLSWRAAATAERPYTWVPAYQGAQQHSVASWSDGARPVLVDRLVYRDQAPRAELIGGANRIAPGEMTLIARVAGPLGPDRRYVNEAIVRSAQSHLLVWYWYRVGSVETAFEPNAKFLELWAFFSRRTASELVSVSTACDPESCAEAAQTLAAFLGHEP